jgi:phage baseplate assembly protein W
MKSLSFPKIIKNKAVQTVSDYDATLQNMKLVLASEKGEFIFDPYFGIRLKRYMFEQNNPILLDVLVDEIYEQLVTFMPQLIINKKDISMSRDRAKVYITIKARNQIDFELNTYNLVLFNSQE